MKFLTRMPFGVLASLTIAGYIGVSADSRKQPESPAPSTNAALIREGSRLFGVNCAHCHAADATGDEGPDLHGVTKSDAKIANFIKNGIKGEMPKFGQKLSDADVQALIAFIRSLKE